MRNEGNRFIKVYVNGMLKPILEVINKTILSRLVGVVSYDNT